MKCLNIDKKTISLVNKIIAYESDEFSDNDTLELFAELIKTGQAWKLQDLTTERGCFNCANLKDCKHCTIPKTKEQLEHIDYSGEKPFRFDCCCGHYKPNDEKEQVKFT